MEFQVIKINDQFWVFEQNGVRSFLLTGPDNAILVDTGFGGDLKALCDTLTEKPITLLTTHSDPDHIGCDHQFTVQHLHPAEFDRYARRAQRPVRARPMWEGDVFTAGAFELEVILVPGHTPGSIALLDRKQRFLLSGDTVQTKCMYMFGDGRSVSALYHSLEKLKRMHLDGVFDTIYASHGELVPPADVMDDQMALAEALMHGTASPVGPGLDRFPDTVKTYRFGKAQMYY